MYIDINHIIWGWYGWFHPENIQCIQGTGSCIRKLINWIIVDSKLRSKPFGFFSNVTHTGFSSDADQMFDVEQQSDASACHDGFHAMRIPETKSWLCESQPETKTETPRLYEEGVCSPPLLVLTYGSIRNVRAEPNNVHKYQSASSNGWATKVICPCIHVPPMHKCV